MKTNNKNNSFMIKIKFIIIIAVLFLSNHNIYSQSGWFQQNSNANEFLSDIFFINPQTGWIAGSSSVIKTTNGGDNWTANSFNPCPYSRFHTIWFTNENNGFVGGYGGGYCVGTDLLFKTSNGGTNWNQFSVIFGPYNSINDFHFINSLTGYFCIDNRDFVTNGSICKTNDGGQNWSVLYHSRYSIISVCFIDSLTGLATGYYLEGYPPELGYDEASVMMKTTDGGASWVTKLSTPDGNGYFKLFFIGNYGWALGNNKLIHTTDTGENWTELLFNGNGKYITSLYFINKDTGWAVGNKGTDTTNIIKTTNGGMNWFDVNNNNNNSYLTSVFFTNENTGWATGTDGTILKTTTGGVTINNIPVTTNVSPHQNEINVNKSSDITATFDQDMNASTINSSNIKVFGLQSGLLSSSVSYNAGTRTATINPNSDFKVGEKIQVTLSSGIKTSDNIPITPFTWTFIVQALGGTGDYSDVSILNNVNVTSMVSGDVDNDGAWIW